MKVKGLLFGVGINDADYDVTITRTVNGKRKIVWTCPFYSRWQSMISRCYDERFHIKNPSYKGCSVCEEWKTLSNFKKWMEQQNWQGKQLDKDILVPENKEYGPRTCIFVSRQLNCILIDAPGYQRGSIKCPKGVSWNKKHKIFYANITLRGRRIYLGGTKTVEEASRLYKKAKSEYLLEWANNLTSEDTSDIELTKEALIRHAGLLLG